MRRVGIPDVLFLLLCSVSLLCFISCSTTVGGVEAGVQTGQQPVVCEGHEHHAGPPPHAPAYGYHKKYTYHYYPDTQVYFDVSRQVYFYIEGDHWQVSAALPNQFRVGLGDYVTIEADTAQPYEYHTEHVHKYPPGQMKDKHKHKENRGKWGDHDNDW